MDVAHHSLPKGLVFTSRIVLGIAVAVGGTVLGLWIFSSSGGDMVGPAIAGLVAGYILKKHFFWALLIPIVAISAPYLLFGGEGGDDFTNVEYAVLFLTTIALPAYLGAFFGYLISRSFGRGGARPH